MENSETEKTEAYQRQMEAAYASEAAGKFKQEHFPADSFDDGILVDAAWLDISELVAIHKAAKALEDQGKEAFVNSLILSRDYSRLPPLVRVNRLFVDSVKQRKLEICQLLYAFYWQPNSFFAEKRAEIIEMEDAQLLEYLQQAEECLGLTAAEMEVIVNAKT